MPAVYKKGYSRTTFVSVYFEVKIVFDVYYLAVRIEADGYILERSVFHFLIEFVYFFLYCKCLL